MLLFNWHPSGHICCATGANAGFRLFDIRRLNFKHIQIYNIGMQIWSKNIYFVFLISHHILSSFHIILTY